jgi:hypothetical protein
MMRVDEIIVDVTERIEWKIWILMNGWRLWAAVKC